MTLKEYINQRNPVRLDNFTVQIKESDCLQVVKRENYRILLMEWYGKTYQYMEHPERKGQVYTRTEHGEVDKPTVFKLID